MISFVETKLFTRLVSDLLGDDEYALLQQALIANPELGDAIPGSGGVRKMRWGGCRPRQTRRTSGHLLFAHQARPNLDAYRLSQERSGQHSRAPSTSDQG